ncbi:hypothetical protein GCM10022199_27810 [Marihabitans asiaticum]|uniref:Uncharacterized protein n=1 Tax=Marihabitans asiaticum TaxID=415218 RepID=A0A560W5Z4_9MICO|nr:hypothetical protein [Marihabitans asiaticum]TWD13041.1 hypothetical protein FB557_2808 [Marihabitans asiaticum]
MDELNAVIANIPIAGALLVALMTFARPVLRLLAVGVFAVGAVIATQSEGADRLLTLLNLVAGVTLWRLGARPRRSSHQPHPTRS